MYIVSNVTRKESYKYEGKNANKIKAQLIYRLCVFHDCGSKVEQKASQERKRANERAENAQLR